MSSFRPAPAVITLLALLFCTWAPAANSYDRPGGPEYRAAAPPVALDSVTGWVVEASDWLDRGQVDAKRGRPALTAANLGAPLVILTGSGRIVYPVRVARPNGPVMDNVRLIPFAEQSITASGRLLERGNERGFILAEVELTPTKIAPPSFPLRESADVHVVGRVVDLGLWLGKGDSFSSGVKHTCADVENGEPLVLIGDSGTIYYPLVRGTATTSIVRPDLRPYCDREVSVDGTLLVRGEAHGIIISRVAAYADKTGTSPKPGS